MLSAPQTTIQRTVCVSNISYFFLYLSYEKKKRVLIIVPRARNDNVRWQRGGETVLWEERTKPCRVVEHFLVGNACKTEHIKNRTKLPSLFSANQSSRSKCQRVKNKSRIFFLSVYWAAQVNIEMTFCGKLNRGGHDQNARIYTSLR